MKAPFDLNAALNCCFVGTFSLPIVLASQCRRKLWMHIAYSLDPRRLLSIESFACDSAQGHDTLRARNVLDKDKHYSSSSVRFHPMCLLPRDHDEIYSRVACFVKQRHKRGNPKIDKKIPEVQLPVPSGILIFEPLLLER
jgi:hypothetical protein